MLANGIKIYGKKKSEAGDFALIPGIKEVPELGNVKEAVDNTALNDSTMTKENGLGDPGDLEYVFRYLHENEKAAFDAYWAAAQNDEVYTFKEELPSGTTFTFDAQFSVVMGGGSVNGVVDWTMTMALQSEITKGAAT